MLRTILWTHVLCILACGPALTQPFTAKIQPPLVLRETRGFFLRTITDLTQADTLLWITDAEGPGVYLFTPNGRPFRSIGEKGQGPQAYLRPQWIRRYEDTLWIWDADLLRFFRVQQSSLQVVEPLGGFGLACKDFLRLSPDTLVFSHGQRAEQFLSLYRVSTGAYLHFTGQGRYEDELLSLLDRTLHLAYQRPWVYFARPSMAEIQRWNPVTRERDVLPLEVPGFEVAPFKGPQVKAITPEALRYVLHEDINRGIWRMGDYLLVFIETGAYAYAPEYPIRVTSLGTKAYHFVFIDPDEWKPLGRITWDTEVLERHHIGGYVGWDPETGTMYFGYWDPEHEDTALQKIIPVRFTRTD